MSKNEVGVARRATLDAKPINDRLIVERVTEVDDPNSTIIIPDAAKEKPCQGKVLAIGPGRIMDNNTGIIIRTPMQMKVGDIVVFAKYSGTDVKINGNDYMVLREDDVLYIL